MTETTETPTAPKTDIVEITRLAKLALMAQDLEASAARISEKRRHMEQAKKEADAEYELARSELVQQHSTALVAVGDANRAWNNLRMHYVPRAIVTRFEETAARVRVLEVAVTGAKQDLSDSRAILEDVKRKGADVPIVQKAAKRVKDFQSKVDDHTENLKTAAAAAGIASDALNAEMKRLLDNGKTEKPKRGRRAK